MFSPAATVSRLGHTARSVLSYLSWCVPTHRRVAQKPCFSSECKLILKTGPSIQSTVLFHEGILVLLVRIHMETDETYNLFLYKHSSTYFFIFFTHLFVLFCPGVQPLSSWGFNITSSSYKAQARSKQRKALSSGAGLESEPRPLTSREVPGHGDRRGGGENRKGGLDRSSRGFPSRYRELFAQFSLKF